jgi:hypothetical protein
MAKLGFKHTSEVQTRDKYTKCNFELGMTLDGRELPNAAVLGAALEDAVKLIQERITESYQVVPPRQEIPAEAVVTQMPAPAEVKPTLGEQIAPSIENPQPVYTPVQPVPVVASDTGVLSFPPGYQQQS